ncbi:MAG TPA: gluconolaconase [Methylophilus sp.]|nr:gluconolaconase [Methylophilus sp.]HQQ34069.1 gluconolaconase [Methylophilus sp.]
MRKLLFLLCIVPALATAKGSEFPSKITGLKMPESVIQAKDGTIYVSEIGEFNGDGDGQISKIDKYGNVTVFAKGMNDPKGLAIIGNKLYVADKTQVLEVNLDGTWRIFTDSSAFPVPPKFLNDLEADRMGNLYVSDSGDLKAGGAIFKIAKDGTVTTIIDSKNPDVLAPNGLLFEGRNNLLEVDFASGILYRLNLSTGAISKIAEGFGGGDGILKGKSCRIYVSDWQNGNVFQLAAGKARLLKSGYKSAADIAISQDKTFIMVPDMKAGELDFISIE